MSWPNFSFPMGGWFFLSLVPLVVLYFLKLKRPRVEIPSLALWQSVVNDQRVNSPFQKFRRNLLLLLQLILLCLVILALMQPFISGGPGSDDYLPVLIDCSASMSSKVEGSNQTRLDLARERAEAMIENLRGDGRIALFSFASGGRRLTEFTNDRRTLLRALDELKPTHRTSSLGEVLRMAEAYARTSSVERVVVITDGNLNESVDFALPFELDIQRIDQGGDNIGITEMNARLSSDDTWDVFVRVAGSGLEADSAELTLTKDDTIVGRESVFASKDNSERIVFSVNAADATLLKATLEPGGFDSLSIDNSVWLSLPKPRPLRVRTSPQLFSWQHAMTVQGDIELDAGETPTAPEYDLLVSDSEDLQGAHAPVIVYTGFVPQELQDLVQIADVDVDDTPVEIVDWLHTAPLLRHVRLRDVQIGEQSRFAEGVTAQKLEERGYEVLIHGAEGPLMLQRRRGLETEFYFLFHTDRSTLPYRVAFPILVTNLLEAAMQQASLSEVAAAPTGVLPPIPVEPDRAYQIRSTDGHSTSLKSTASGVLTGAQADHIGRYDVLDGNDIVASVGTGLLSPLETSLAAVSELKFAEVEVSTQESQLLETDRHLWWILALLAFVFLLIEWWYFQRRKGGLAA